MTSFQAEIRARASQGGRGREEGIGNGGLCGKWLFRGSVVGTGLEKLVQAARTSNREILRCLQVAHRSEPAQWGGQGQREAGREPRTLDKPRETGGGWCAHSKEFGFSSKPHWKPRGHAEKECVMI